MRRRPAGVSTSNNPEEIAMPESAFAWLQIPSADLSQPIDADFHFSYVPNIGAADNVTPPHPRNLPIANPKSVSITTNGGTWTISGSVGGYLVAGGPVSMMSNNQWDPAGDKDSWTGTQDVLVIAIKRK
jgi:hypothetical protein